MAKTRCEYCGRTFDSGGNRYKERPTRYCGDRCNQAAWREVNRPPQSPRGAARAAALQRLKAAHLSEFARYLREEEDERGVEHPVGFVH